MKKTFAKKIALIMAVVCAFGVSGCKKEEEKPQETAVQTEETVEEEKEFLQDALLLAEDAPELTASAAILIEESTGTILYQKKADERMYPASMTKVLTALVALDYFKPEELVKVGYEINEISLDSSKAGHVVGEMLTMKNAIRGLIIPSGNDSANVIAAAVARRAENDDSISFARCEQIFTDLMNKKAEELGAKDSHFSNAHGYHAPDHYTTAKDMALISKAFMENPTLEEIANERSFVGNGADNMFTTDESVKTQDYAWRSHNLLITGGEYNYGYASGIKTGFTNEAGDCVTAAARNDAMDLIAVIFHSEDPNRWIDSKNLFEYGFNQYEEKVVFGGNESLEEIPLTKHKKSGGDTLSAVLGEPLVAYLPVGGAEKLKTTITCNETYAVTDKEGNLSLKAPIEKGAEIGTVSIEADGKVVMEAPVYAGRTVEKGTIFSMIADLFRNLFTLKGMLVFVGILVGIFVVFLIVRMVLRHRQRRRGGYSLGRPSRRNTGLTMNLNGKKQRTRKRRRF
ncbi:MAG: D-alanyl-D-alanine carboxypeptidase family protein [Bacillota bacterium]|nr:D-alanyl-D-alanine carboxypeptidase family protein [Bacillota bacterium]